MRASDRKPISTTFLAGLICLSTACTTMRSITVDTAGEQVRAQLKPGDTVRVLTKSGASHTFEITAVGATSLDGKAVKIVGVSSSEPWGAPVEVLYADIAQIEVRRVQVLVTAGIIAAVIAVFVGVSAARHSQSKCCTSY
jgi:hypothetical protein